jgi:hypothetical protein
VLCVRDSTQRCLEFDNGVSRELRPPDLPVSVGNPTVSGENPAVSVASPASSIGSPAASVATPMECVSTAVKVGDDPDMLGSRPSRKLPDTEKNAGETFLIRRMQRYTQPLIAGCPGRL